MPVARDTDRIEREIEEARERLASTLDQLGERANPKKLADSAKQGILDTLQKPQVAVPIAGFAALVTLLIVGQISRSRRESKIIKAIASGAITL